MRITARKKGPRRKAEHIVSMEEVQMYSSLVEELEAAFTWVNQVVVGQEPAAAMLKLALLTRQNMLLEGAPGVAKSRLAAALFTAFPGSRCFTKLFTGDTMPDEVFGALNPVLLRSKGVVRFNTEGMLPQARFAVLEEFFNAGRSIQGGLYTILNERYFINGGQVDPCPLWTAVACVNKVPTDEEFHPIVDRFIFWARVGHATSSEQRLRILSAFQEAPDSTTLRCPVSFEFSDLALLNQGVTKVILNEDLLALLEKLHKVANEVATAGGYTRAISDRRFCWAYRALQAAVFIASQGDVTAPQEPTALYEAAKILTVDPSCSLLVQAKFAEILAEIQVKTSQEQLLASTQADISELANTFQPKKQKKRELQRLLGSLDRLIAGLQDPTVSTGKPWLDSTFVNRAAQSLALLLPFRDSVAEAYGEPTTPSGSTGNVPVDPDINAPWNPSPSPTS